MLAYVHIVARTNTDKSALDDDDDDDGRKSLTTDI
jgi:hypothetical protein